MMKFAERVFGPTEQSEWRMHWPVVFASMVGYSLSLIHVYSLGVMIAPLEDEFGWTRTFISSGYLIVSTMIFLFSSVVGMAIDRFGPRRIAIYGIFFYCLAIGLLGTAQHPVWTWVLLWFLVGVSCLLVKATVWVAAVSSLFSASRGLALAVALSGSGLISSAGPLFTSFLVESVGWRMAYVLWSGLAFAIAFPVIFFFFSSATDNERSDALRHSAPKQPATSKVPLRERGKSAVFVKLGVASAVVSMIFTAFIVNLVPIMTSLGIEKTNAAAIAGTVGISQIIGRLASGILLDRFNARLVTALVVCFPIVTCTVHIFFSGSMPFAVVAAIAFGLSVGAELDAVAYLASRYFGTANFGALFGTIMGFTALGGGLGPIAANLAYDLTGSYAPVLWAIIPLTLASAYLLLTLGPYPEEAIAIESGTTYPDS